jgi:murein DD-endopeptidase MepM/ murein hydrolase activator NlpD
MRILAGLSLFFLLVSSTGVFAEKLSEEQKLKAIQEKLEESKQKLQKTKAEEQEVLGRLVVISKELNVAKQNLNLTTKKINANEEQIGTLSTEIAETEKYLRTKEKGLTARVKEVYKSSGLNYLELLIASRSMSDFFNRLYFFRKIIDHDAALVNGIRTEVASTRQKKEKLQEKTREIRTLAKVFAEEKQEIAGKAQEKQKIYESLKQRRIVYEAQVAELEKSSHELEVLILKKMAERKGGKVRGSGVLAWPVEGRITSNFGYRRHPLWGGRHFHTGLDIAAKYGTPVKSADSGEVIFSGWWDGYGKAVVVDHGHGTTTVYAHLSRIYKQVGAIVAKGQVVGLIGSTGYSTGPHLHFEVRKNGKPVNPISYL